MKRFLVACVLAALAAGARPPAASAANIGPASCPAERAVYELKWEDETFRAAFIPARNDASIASDLYYRLTTPQREYWFKFNVSQGYSGMTLFPVSNPYDARAAANGPRDLLGPPYGDNKEATAATDVLVSLRFYALDEELNFLVEPPMRGEDAPAFVMTPEIGLTLWYEPTAISEDKTAFRDPMPRGMFRRTACLVAPPPEAYP
jgi:hypothetical protein